MDQGWAALLAAIVGLVGALGGAAAGGYAAIRGAREGAERSARALQEQAKQQAQDQFEHWLRLERRAIYTDALQDADTLQTKLADFANSRREGDDSRAVDALLEFEQAFRQLNRRAAPLVTVAHPAVVQMYQSLMIQCERVLNIVQSDLSGESLWRDISRNQDRLTVAVAELIGAISVDTQAGPAERRGMR